MWIVLAPQKKKKEKKKEKILQPTWATQPWYIRTVFVLA